MLESSGVSSLQECPENWKLISSLVETSSSEGSSLLWSSLLGWILLVPFFICELVSVLEIVKETRSQGVSW